MRIAVSALTEESMPEIAAIYAQAWRLSHADICSEAFLQAHTPERMQEELEAAQKDGLRIFAAYAQGKAAGMAAVDVNGRELKRLYVAPQYWGTGVAQALLQAVTDELGQGGIRLTVLSCNARARRFYEKQGFRCTGVERVLREETGLCELTYQREGA